MEKEENKKEIKLQKNHFKNKQNRREREGTKKEVHHAKEKRNRQLEKEQKRPKNL